MILWCIQGENQLETLAGDKNLKSVLPGSLVCSVKLQGSGSSDPDSNPLPETQNMKNNSCICVQVLGKQVEFVKELTSTFWRTLNQQWVLTGDSTKILFASFFSCVPLTQSIFLEKQMNDCPNTKFGSCYAHFECVMDTRRHYIKRYLNIRCFLVSMTSPEHA